MLPALAPCMLIFSINKAIYKATACHGIAIHNFLAGESFARPLRSSSHSAIRGRKSKLGIRDGMALRTISVLDRGKVLDYTESIATMDFSGGRCHR
jgi:hypothetical protein